MEAPAHAGPGIDADADVLAVARLVAERIAGVPGVTAIVLGGSWAAGTARADSDVDVGLLLEDATALSLASLRRAVATLDDEARGAAVTEPGAWGRWIDGGAWLAVQRRRVDLLYRRLPVVRDAIAECRAGRPSTHYQPGHPHGFRTDILLAEVHHAYALWDPDGHLARLKADVQPYPEALRRTNVATNLWEAAFTLDHAAAAEARRDVHQLTGCLYRASTCLALALLAHERTWVLHEKNGLRQAGALPTCPPTFVAAVEGALAGVAPAGGPVQALRTELEHVRGVCAS